MKKILLIIIAVVALCACGDNRRVQSSEQSGESSEQQDSDTSPKDLAALQVLLQSRINQYEIIVLVLIR